MSDRLWTQAECADYLRVSVRYLRDSSCPRVALPSVTGSKPLLRYDPDQVKRWFATRTRKAS